MTTITPDWRAAIDDYLAWRAAAGKATSSMTAWRQHLQHLARRTEHPPHTITGRELVAYAAAQAWARDTRRGRRNTLASFFAWAQQTGLRGDDPTGALPEVDAATPRPRPVPDDVYLEALWRADDDERLWIDLAAEHGLRRAEIARIHERDLVPTLAGWDLAVHGKGDKPRTVPLTGAMAEALLEREGWLFPGDDAGHVSPRWLGKRVNRLLEDDWTIHKLRHRAATRFWIASDGDPYAVAELMGWSNLAMVRTYVAVPTDRLRAVLERASRTTSLRSP